MSRRIKKGRSFQQALADSEKREYTIPILTHLGSFATLTLGNNGSSCDGNIKKSPTQLGGGNDGRGPKDCSKVIKYLYTN